MPKKQPDLMTVNCAADECGMSRNAFTAWLDKLGLGSYVRGAGREYHVCSMDDIRKVRKARQQYYAGKQAEAKGSA